MSPELEDLLQRWPMGEDLPVPIDSTVIVAGAYKGLVMALVDELYAPARIVGFEPQEWAREEATQRLAGRGNCELYPYGIGVADVSGAPMVEYETDACSFVVHPTDPGRAVGTGDLREVGAVLAELGIDKVAMLILNAEGYEFELLPYLIQTGLIARFDAIAVQWHLRLGNDRCLPRLILDLAKSHDLHINEFPQWTLWRRKAAKKRG